MLARLFGVGGQREKKVTALPPGLRPTEVGRRPRPGRGCIPTPSKRTRRRTTLRRNAPTFRRRRSLKRFRFFPDFRNLSISGSALILVSVSVGVSSLPVSRPVVAVDKTFWSIRIRQRQNELLLIPDFPFPPSRIFTIKARAYLSGNKL